MAHQRPKLEDYDDSYFIVLKTARYDERAEQVHFGEVHIFAAAGYVDRGPPREAKRAGPGRGSGSRSGPSCCRQGPASVVWAILDKVVDDYEPVVDGDRGRHRGGRGERLRRRPPTPTERIYFLKREVIEFHRAVGPLLAPLRATRAAARTRRIADELRRYFRDVADHARRVDEQVNSQRELLTSILEANLALVSVSQNEVVKRDLRLGGDHRRADLHRQRLRDELRAHAGARAGSVGYPLCLRDDGGQRRLPATATSSASTGSRRLSAEQRLRPATVVSMKLPVAHVAGTFAPLEAAAAAGRRAALRAARVDARRLGRPVPVWRQICFAGGPAADRRRRCSPLGARRRRARRRAHGPAPADRRHRGAAARARAHRAAAAAAARAYRVLGWLRVLGNPLVALPLWALNLYFWHLPALYTASSTARRCTRSSTRCFFTFGVRDVDAAARPAAASRPGSATAAKLVYMIVVRFARAVLANVLMWSGTVFYPDYAPGEASGTSPRSPTRARPAVMMMVEGGSSPSACSPGSSSAPPTQAPRSRGCSTSPSARGFELDPARAGARRRRRARGSACEERILATDARPLSGNRYLLPARLRRRDRQPRGRDRRGAADGTVLRRLDDRLGEHDRRRPGRALGRLLARRPVRRSPPGHPRASASSSSPPRCCSPSSRSSRGRSSTLSRRRPRPDRGRRLLGSLFARPGPGRDPGRPARRCAPWALRLAVDDVEHAGRGRRAPVRDLDRRLADRDDARRAAC